MELRRSNYNYNYVISLLLVLLLGGMVGILGKEMAIPAIALNVPEGHNDYHKVDEGVLMETVDDTGADLQQLGFFSLQAFS